MHKQNLVAIKHVRKCLQRVLKCAFLLKLMLNCMFAIAVLLFKLIMHAF